MEDKYQKGKIYKIVDVGYNKCYIGSTIEPLSNRMSRHRSQYKDYKKGNQHYIKSFDLFEENGVENCKIELIENYPCNCKEELRAREGQYQQSIDCVNRQVAGRSTKQWSIEHQQHVKESKRNNYVNKKPEIQQKHKLYYENKKEEIFKRIREKCICDCGIAYSYGHKARHEKSNRHQKRLQSVEQQD